MGSPELSGYPVEAIQVVRDDDNLTPLVADKKTLVRVWEAFEGEKPALVRSIRVFGAEIPVQASLLGQGTLEVEATVNLVNGEAFEAEASTASNTLV